MTPVFEIDGLSVDLDLPGSLLGTLLRRKPALVNLLQGITLAIRPGETFGLIGESGSGKTTLARTMLGLTRAAGGTMKFDGQTLGTRHAFGAMRRDMAMMFQDPVASLSPRMTVGALLTEPFVIHRLPIPDSHGRAKELLDRVGLPPGLAKRYPHELSGGQARRVCLARALALNPRLVIADEPTAGLDVSVQGEILNLMTGLKAQSGVSFMIITHNLAMVRHVSDRIAILYLGRLIETGPTRTVFAHPLHPYTQNLIASEPQPDPRKRRSDLAIKGEIPSVLNRPAGCEFHTRCAVARDLCRTTAPELRAVPDHRQVRCHFA